MLRQTSENIIASIVDFISIFVAYRIGVQELGIMSGMIYGIFDAWIVVWQRERITNFIRLVVTKVKQLHVGKRDATLSGIQDLARSPECLVEKSS